MDLKTTIISQEGLFHLQETPAQVKVRLMETEVAAASEKVSLGKRVGSV